MNPKFQGQICQLPYYILLVATRAMHGRLYIYIYIYIFTNAGDYLIEKKMLSNEKKKIILSFYNVITNLGVCTGRQRLIQS